MQKGSIEVICGSMFSGKTEELLKRLRKAKLTKMKIAVFKPKVDSRYDSKDVVSHDKNTISSTPIEKAEDILQYVSDVQIIAIDETQFFDDNLINVCNMLANTGKRIIIAGLDMDFLGQPFGVMPQLLAIAEKIKKVHAVCVECGKEASYSFRKTTEKDLIKIGEKNEYKALCRNCFVTQN